MCFYFHVSSVYLWGGVCQKLPLTLHYIVNISRISTMLT